MNEKLEIDIQNTVFYNNILISRTMWSKNLWIGGSHKSYVNTKGDEMGIKDRKAFAPVLKNSRDHQVSFFDALLVLKNWQNCILCYILKINAALTVLHNYFTVMFAKTN